MITTTMKFASILLGVASASGLSEYDEYYSEGKGVFTHDSSEKDGEKDCRVGSALHLSAKNQHGLDTYALLSAVESDIRETRTDMTLMEHQLHIGAKHCSIVRSGAFSCCTIEQTTSNSMECLPPKYWSQDGDVAVGFCHNGQVYADARICDLNSRSPAPVNTLVSNGPNKRYEDLCPHVKTTGDFDGSKEPRQREKNNRIVENGTTGYRQ